MDYNLHSNLSSEYICKCGFSPCYDKNQFNTSFFEFGSGSNEDRLIFTEVTAVCNTCKEEFKSETPRNIKGF